MGSGLRNAAILLFLAAIGTDALAVVLCAKARGDGSFSSTVKIREECRPTETQLDPVALGLQGPSGPQGVPGPGFVLRDANGTVVGVVSDRPINTQQYGENSSTELAIVRSEGGRLFTFEAGSDGIRPADTIAFLYYEGAGCTGRTGMSVDPVTYLIPRAVVVDSSHVFYAWGAPMPMNVVSTKEIGRNVNATICANRGGTFTPPHICCWDECASTPCPLNAPLGFETDLSSLVPPFRVEMQ